MKKGKLIVLDGTDGSGKATQVNLLIQRLAEAGFNTSAVDFPQYGQKSAGPVEEYLTGKYGRPDELGAYIPSVFYAVDRFAAKKGMIDDLKNERIIVSNRYVSANMGHQGGKLSDNQEREDFLDWVHELEFEIFGLPRPDLTLILHVSPETSQRLVDKKEKRGYTKGEKRDVHEADIDHLRAAEKAYLEIAEKFGYDVIECEKGGGILSREAISDLIWEKVKQVL